MSNAARYVLSSCTWPVDSLLTLSSKFLKFDFNTQPNPVVFWLDCQLDNLPLDLLWCHECMPTPTTLLTMSSTLLLMNDGTHPVYASTLAAPLRSIRRWRHEACATPPGEHPTHARSSPTHTASRPPNSGLTRNSHAVRSCWGMKTITRSVARGIASQRERRFRLVQSSGMIWVESYSQKKIRNSVFDLLCWL